MIGALFMKEESLRYSFAESTNKGAFLEFLQKRVHQFVKYPRSTVLVLDNHRAHHSKLVTDWLQEKQYVISFLPPYSSELNPIETVWCLMKHEWGKRLLTQDMEEQLMKINRPLKDRRDELEENSDGEFVVTSRQKMTERELKASVGDILDGLDRRQLHKLARGCCRIMLKLMAKEVEQCRT